MFCINKTTVSEGLEQKEVLECSLCTSIERDWGLHEESTALKNTLLGEIRRKTVWHVTVAFVGPLYFPLRWEVLVGIIKVSSAIKVTGLSFWCYCTRGH